MIIQSNHLRTSYTPALVDACSATLQLAAHNAFHRTCLPARDLALLVQQLAHVHVALAQAYLLAQLVRLRILHVLREDCPNLSQMQQSMNSTRKLTFYENAIGLCA